jgi:cytochrome c-type biogenesis protein CcmH/NrfG
MKIVSLVVAAVLAAPVSAFACGDYMGFRTPEERIAIARTQEGWRARMAASSLAYDETVNPLLRAEAFAILGADQMKNGEHDAALESLRQALKLDQEIRSSLKG